jgi:hypothetical protein
VCRAYLFLSLLIFGLLPRIGLAEAYKLTTGETLNGEVLSTSANDQGVQVKIGEGQYQRVPWTSFSQEDLRAFAKNQKMEPFVAPFIEVSQAEKLKKTEPNVKQPPRLERPPKQSLVGAMFSSSLGILLVLLIYAANIYAGYEVAIYRARPPVLVAGLSAIPGLGFAAPIVFLSLPTQMKGTAGETKAAAADAPAPAATDEINPMKLESAEHPGGLRVAADTQTKSKPALPEPVVYKRGQFTFNRRFFETKLAGFFGMIRRDAERDLVLTIKSNRGEFVADRISRIAANDFHIQVAKGPASEEVMISFQEVQEIRIKHKDA